MKVIILLILVVVLLSCSTTQSMMQNSQSETTLTNDSKQNYGKTPKFGDPEIGPYPIKTIQPKYPSSARNAGIEGQVILQVEVFADGSVGAIEVLKSLQAGSGGLDETAVQAVRKWTFQPAMAAKEPVASWTILPVNFSLK